jgi:hypothetical protein
MCGIIDDRPREEDDGDPQEPPDDELSIGQLLARKLGFSFNGPEADCIDNAKKNAQMLLQELLVPGALVDPCSPSNTAEEILHDVVEAACGSSGNLTIMELNAELPQSAMSIHTESGLINAGINIEGCCLSSDFSECLEEEVSEILEANNGFIMDEDDEDVNICEALLAFKSALWTLRAIKGKDARDEALEYMNSLWGTALGFGDCRDAYRHALWMAIFAQKTSQEVAIEFGIAHECSTPVHHQLNHMPMDLHNNWIGASIGNAFPNATISEISALVCDALENGSLKRLDPSDNTVIVFTNETSCMCPE